MSIILHAVRVSHWVIVGARLDSLFHFGPLNLPRFPRPRACSRNPTHRFGSYRPTALLIIPAGRTTPTPPAGTALHCTAAAQRAGRAVPWGSVFHGPRTAAPRPAPPASSSGKPTFPTPTTYRLNPVPSASRPAVQLHGGSPTCTTLPRTPPHVHRRPTPRTASCTAPPSLFLSCAPIILR